MNKKILSLIMVATLLISLISSNMVIYADTMNLINADFETDTNGFGGRGDGKAEQSSTQSYDGLSSLRIYDRVDFWHGAEVNVQATLKSDVEYTSSMWVYQESGSEQNVKLSLQFTNGGGQNWVQFADGNVPSGVWTEVSGVLTVASNGVFSEAVAYIEAGALGFDIFVDNIVVTYDDSGSVDPGNGGGTPPIQGHTGTIEDAGFEIDEEGWIGRGDAVAAVSTIQAFEGSQSLSVTGRTDGWHGSQKDLLASYELDTEYSISFMVYHESGQDEEIKMTFENTVGGVKGYDQAAVGMVPSGVWTEVSSVFTKANTGELTEAILYFEASTVDLSFYLDNVSVSYELPSWEGMATSFETGLDGFTPRVGTEEVSVSTEQYRTGLQSAKVTSRVNAYDGIKFEYSNLAENSKDYVYSLWVYQDSGSDKEIQMATEKRLATISYERIGSASVASGVWTKISGEYTLNYSDTLTHFSLYLEAPDATLTFYVDDVTISTTTASVITIQEDIPNLYDSFIGDFTVGVAIPSGTLSTDVETALVKKHFNSITAENDMKPMSILDSVNRGEVDNTNNDLYFNYAKDNGLKLRGHTLVWHQQTPDWFFNEGFADDGALVSREVMLERLDKYIGDVVKNYDADILYAWDVVNEAIDTGEADNMRQSLWKQVVGPDFVEKAFEITRKHTEGMNVKLFYNDYNTNDSAKRAAIYDLVTDLYDKGLVDGIGLQSHLALEAPSVDKIEETIQLFGDYGLEVQITELDIDIYTGGVSSYDEAPEEIMIKQGYRYKELFDMFRANSDVISNVTVWGLTDNRSWLNSFPVIRNNWPLIFDKDLQAKYAYYGIVDPSLLPVFSKEVGVFKGSAMIDGTEDFEFEIQKSIVLEATAETPRVDFKTLWNDTNLYIKAMVSDETVDLNDSITIMLDVDRSKSDDLEAQDIVVNVNRDGSLSQDVLVNEVNDIQSILTEVNGGYSIEIAIPMYHGLAKGDKIGFDLGIINDSKLIKWNDQYDNTTVSPKRFGTLILKDELKSTVAKIGEATIDGLKDVIWENANNVQVNNFSQNSVGSTAVVSTLWDTDFLYVYAEINDDSLSKISANAYEQDSIEIFVDENNNRTSSYELDDVQYRVNFDNETSLAGGPSNSNFESATRTTDTGYVVEAKIPFNLDMEEVGMIIGFDLQINNDDGSGSRTSISNWNDISGNGWRDTQNFGVLVLGSQPAKVTTTSGGSSTGSNNSSTPDVKIEENEVPLELNMPYIDVFNTHWAASAISALTSKGIISGNGKNEFLPNNNISRVEFTKLVVYGFDLLDEEAVESFNDVDDSNWYYSVVASAQSKGIIKGLDDNFNPNEFITREDMAVILFRALKAVHTFEDSSKMELIDIELVADYALEAVTKLHQAGVVQGDEGKAFNPKSTSKRAEAAQIIYEALELIAK